MTARIEVLAPHIEMDGKDEPTIREIGHIPVLYVGTTEVARSTFPAGGAALANWARRNGASIVHHRYDLALDEVERQGRTR